MPFLAVCLVRAIVDVIGVVEIMCRYCYDDSLGARRGSPKSQYQLCVMRALRNYYEVLRLVLLTHIVLHLELATPRPNSHPCAVVKRYQDFSAKIVRLVSSYDVDEPCMRVKMY